VTVANLCETKSLGCTKDDPAAISNLRAKFGDFLEAAQRRGIYRATRPVSVEQYFRTEDDSVDAILCTDKDQSDAPLQTALLDAPSPIRIRGVSDDLWVPQPPAGGSDTYGFAKTSSTSVNYTADDSGLHTHTTKIQTAIGYDYKIGDFRSPVTHEFIPFIAMNESLTDTQLKPRNNAATNFVAAGLLYDLDVEGAYGLHQFILKPQFIAGTTMRSELASLQAIYTPWIDAGAVAPLQPLNTVVPLYSGDQFQITGQLLFDLRADFGAYAKRGDQAFIASNQDFVRVGSRFGYALVVNSSLLPSFALSVTHTELYGPIGAYRHLGFFDALLSIYLDPKKNYSLSVEYTNGRDENTYIVTEAYKAGIAAHF
jgi:hypothetical protein